MIRTRASSWSAAIAPGDKNTTRPSGEAAAGRTSIALLAMARRAGLAALAAILGAIPLAVALAAGRIVLDFPMTQLRQTGDAFDVERAFVTPPRSATRQLFHKRHQIAGRSRSRPMIRTCAMESGWRRVGVKVRTNRFGSAKRQAHCGQAGLHTQAISTARGDMSTAGLGEVVAVRCAHSRRRRLTSSGRMSTTTQFLLRDVGHPTRLGDAQP